MFRMIGNFIHCLFAPRLYRTYPTRGQANFQLTDLGQIYETNFAERWGDQMVSYMIPFGTIYCIWQRKFHLMIYLGIFIMLSYGLRAAGRSVNSNYLAFLQVLSKAQQSFNTENAENLRKYDFQFVHWPVSYISTKAPMPSSCECIGGGLLATPLWFIGWLVAHTIGIRLIYPGMLLSYLLRIPLEEGRARQVLLQRGVRTRIGTADRNTLDTMFFDHRRDLHPNGRTLVICFEGNAGFYEIGMLNTALDLKYSVLGFNHPGFAGSTGAPYPTNEKYAAEAIFDYATTQLGFKEEEIIFYGWSIGGYGASYLASSHPRVKALILDATFDDIMPLALPRMPALLSSIVHSTIRNHVDLRVNKEVKGYPGPLSLIRRTEDEIIADPPNVLSTNRGNFLLVDVIRDRYPTLLDNPTSEKNLSEWLSKPHVADPNTSAVTPEPNIPANVTSLSDLEKGRLVTAIAEKLLIDYKSTHCTPLPTSLFRMPWTPKSELKS